jgi:hypothetical protein
MVRRYQRTTKLTDEDKKRFRKGTVPTRRLYHFTTDFRIAITDSKSVEDRPYGYLRLVAFVASEPNLMDFLEFRAARSRVLLHLQAEIQFLEDQLYQLDQCHLIDGFERVQSHRKDKIEYANESAAENCNCPKIPEKLRLKISQDRTF